jgi:hypothetical protein
MREALVELATSRPAMAKAALPKRQAAAATPALVLNYDAPRKPRVAAPIKVAAMRPRMREAVAAAR